MCGVDTLNTANLTLTATYNNGTTETITSGFTCTPTALDTAGEQTITVTYGGMTCTFNVSVSENIGDLEFTLINNGSEYEVSDCSISASGSIAIPPTYNGKPVTSIGNRAFEECTEITTVSIPDSETHIGDCAFRDCMSLAAVTIPDSVTHIGTSAFQGCKSLTSVTIPSSVTSIGFFAFLCFDNITKETNLSSINVSSDNQYFSSVDGVLFNKEQTLLLQYPAGKPDTDYTIPSTVTEIDFSAFFVCQSLTSVTILSSVTTIGAAAFDGCSASLVIYGYAGSAAETYANENDITFSVISASVKGDVNGDGCTDAGDAVLISRYDAGLTTLTSAQLAAGDVNGDGCVDAGDAVIISRYDAGLISKI